MDNRTLALLVSIGLFLLVIELVRRGRLTFKYALGWLSLSTLAVLCAVFNAWLTKIATILGFELTSNFIFFALLGGFVFLSVLLTIFVCEQNARNDTMAQKIALLEHEVEHLKQQKNS